MPQRIARAPCPLLDPIVLEGCLTFACALLDEALGFYRPRIGEDPDRSQGRISRSPRTSWPACWMIAPRRSGPPDPSACRTAARDRIAGKRREPAHDIDHETTLNVQ